MDPLSLSLWLFPAGREERLEAQQEVSAAELRCEASAGVRARGVALELGEEGRDRDLGSGRIVVSETDAPKLFVNLV